MDGGAWWAAVYGVTPSRTRLKRLSSSKDDFGCCEPSAMSILSIYMFGVCSYIYLRIDLFIFSCIVEITWKLQSACPEYKYRLCHYLAVLL